MKKGDTLFYTKGGKSRAKRRGEEKRRDGVGWSGGRGVGVVAEEGVVGKAQFCEKKVDSKT